MSPKIERWGFCFSIYFFAVLKKIVMKMPPIILERIPLPSLYTYSAISVMLFACSSIYVHLLYSLDSQRTSFSTPEFSDLHVYVNRSLRDKLIFYSASFMQEPWCFAVRRKDNNLGIDQCMRRKPVILYQNYYYFLKF